VYTDEIELEALSQALERAALSRNAQASPHWTTLESAEPPSLPRASRLLPSRSQTRHQVA
jgi:hypothetical protein